MNFGESLAWLYGAQTFGIKLGLENTRRLLAAAGDPQHRLRFIHVAGTNGKGSVCAMAHAMLSAAGIRAGLYTSPHLVDFRERIRVGGEMIPEEGVAEGLSLLRDAADAGGIAPTFFELATVLAAWWCERAGAEVVAWETGMGGRLDATNAVCPAVSVITPIGMDHQEHLGDSLARIAAEKAGILKRGVPAVSAPQVPEARAALDRAAAECRAHLEYIDGSYSGALGLRGAHQRANAALACAALDAAGLVPDAGARARGLASVAWPGRFHIAGDVVIDGAHNVHAAEVLVRAWREEFCESGAKLVFGALADKNPESVMRVLRDIADEVWLVSVRNPRAASVAQLSEAARSVGFARVHGADDLAGAIASARSSGGPVLVAGSLFLAGEALALLEGRDSPRPSAQ